MLLIMIYDEKFSLFLIYLRLKKNNQSPCCRDFGRGRDPEDYFGSKRLMVDWGLELSYIKLQFGPDLNNVQI